MGSVVTGSGGGEALAAGESPGSSGPIVGGESASASEPVVVDVLDSHGRATSRQRLQVDSMRRRFTIGRSVAADVMLDDPHIAPVHAAVDVLPDGALAVSDLGSVNGVFVGGERHRGAAALSLTDGRLRIGRTNLRIHTAAQSVAAEKPDHGFDDMSSRSASRVALFGALACIAFICYFAWVGASRDTALLIVVGLAGGSLIAALWISFWTLLSRVIRGESRWVMHAAILFGVSAVLAALEWLLDLARFAFALPQWPVHGISLTVIMLMVALYLHVGQVWTMRRRTALALASLVPLMIFGTLSWVKYRNESRDVNFIGVSEKIFPPVFRLREGGSMDSFFEEAASLRDEADAKRKAIPADDNGDGDED